MDEPNTSQITRHKPHVTNAGNISQSKLHLKTQHENNCIGIGQYKYSFQDTTFLDERKQTNKQKRIFKPYRTTVTSFGAPMF